MAWWVNLICESRKNIPKIFVKKPKACWGFYMPYLLQSEVLEEIGLV